MPRGRWRASPEHVPAVDPQADRVAGRSYSAVTRWFVGGAAAALLVADLAITSLHPWADLQRLLGGLIHPDFPAVEIWSVVYTVAFAVGGMNCLIAALGSLLLMRQPTAAEEPVMPSEASPVASTSGARS